MENKTLYAVIALVVLGAGAVFVLRAPEKGQQTGAAPRPIAELRQGDFGSVDITTAKGEKIALTKKADGWHLGDAAADKTAVTPLLEGLGKLTFGDPVTEETKKYDDLGVADGKAPHVVVKDPGGKVLADLWVGKSIGGFVMVRPAGHVEVWQSSGLSSFVVDKEPKVWRDHTVVDFAAPDAEQLSVVSGGDALVVDKVKAGDKASWKISRADGTAPKTSDALDAGEVDGTIGQLAQLRAADFADGKKAADVGLDPARLTVTVTAKGKKYAISVGNETGDDLYIKGDGPQIYTIKRFSLERAAHRPIDYRDKTLLAVADGDIAAIDLTVGKDSATLTRAGAAWKSAAGALDDTKVKGLVGGLARIAGDRFADASESVGTQSGAVVVHKKDGSTIALHILGASKDGQSEYVQKVGKPETLLVKKWTIDRVLKKPSDLVAGAKAPTVANAKPAPPAGGAPIGKKTKSAK